MKPITVRLSLAAFLLGLPTCTPKSATDCPPNTTRHVDEAADGTVTWFCVTPDAVKHGPTAATNRMNEWLYTGQFANGKRAGLWKYYSPNGAVKKTEEYVDGQLFEETIKMPR